MSQVDLPKIILLLKQFVAERGSHLDLTLLGGLALAHYGMRDRATIDVDAEVGTHLYDPHPDIDKPAYQADFQKWHDFFLK